MYNRKTRKNASGFILGTPGSGKSFITKEEMIHVYLSTNDDILIIDPEGEYSKLSEKLQGEVICISPNSKGYINPMEMSRNYSVSEDDEEADPITLKSEFILSLFESTLGGRYGLSSTTKTIIDRCLIKTYAKYVASGYDEDLMPTLKDFYRILKEQPEEEAKQLAVELEIYVSGSLNVFAHPTNVNLHKRLVVFDIRNLGKQLKTMGLLIVLDNIWNRITSNRNKGKNTWIYIDEVYLLYQNEYSAQFLFELYKRARKWGGIPTSITQNVSDLLQSETARSMLSNSDFILMLNQAKLDRVKLAELLNISDAQLSYVTNSNEGQGLIFCGDSIIPFENKFPKDTHLYKMMTTKLSEVSQESDGIKDETVT